VNNVSADAGEPNVIALVSLEELQGFVPDGYVGLVLATGSTVFEAVRAMEQRAIELARKAIADRAARHASDPGGRAYAVLGLRFAAGITASGEPEWAAYGTLARGHAQPRPVPAG
jgi:hypothetical protein